MKALGIAIWLNATLDGGSNGTTGEYSQGEIAAWEAAARRARRREWLGRLLTRRIGLAAILTRGAGGRGQNIAAR